MTTEMVPCPHCGTPNSARKRVCHQCQRELADTSSADAPARRALRPRGLQAAPGAHPTAPESSAVPFAPEHSSPFLAVDLLQRAQVYRQLQQMLHAGIPVGLSLNYLESSITPRLRPVTRELCEHVQRGGRLSTVMARYPNLFPSWEMRVIESAEAGGTLTQATGDIAETLEAEMELRQAVKGKTFYLRAVGWLFLFVLLIVINARAAADNPAIQTEQQAVANAIRFIRNCLAITLGSALGVAVLAVGWRLWSHTRKGARMSQRLLARLPLIGPIMRNVRRLRFARILGTMWQAGVAPIEALQTAAYASDDPQTIRQVEEQLPNLAAGGSLIAVLAATGLLAKEHLYLVKTGALSGGVPEALGKIVEYTRAQLDFQLKRLPLTASLLLFLVLGPAVAILVITTLRWYFLWLLQHT